MLNGQGVRLSGKYGEEAIKDCSYFCHNKNEICTVIIRIEVMNQFTQKRKEGKMMSTESESKLLFSLSIVQFILSALILLLPVMYLITPEEENLLLYGIMGFGVINLLAGISNRIKGQQRSGMFYSIAGVVLFAIGVSMLMF